MRLEPGSRLGPYEVVAPLGAGGMGEVYRARDPRLGREVALKVLPADLLRDADRLARFEREARSASALNHPNIVTIHDFSSLGGEAWLVMELIRGESLRTLLSRGPLPVKRVMRIAAGIAEGLAAAHGAGIVHRDLKPENIMIGTDGTPKILDFGLVKNVIPSQMTDSPTELQVSRSGMVLGTASYMSPEQARGEDVDFRTDHFSFGLILSEMITGRHPFARATPIETLAAIMNEEPRPLPHDVPEPLAWIVERCLARDRNERYGSTADLAHDLRRTTERPRAATAVAAPRRKRLHFAWLLLLPLLILPFLLRRRGTEVFAQPIHVDIATPGLSEIPMEEISVPVVLSPDGRHLLIEGTANDGQEGIWIRDLRAGTTRLFAENATMPVWSPDGKRIAYYGDGKLKIMSLEGGPASVVCDARAEGMPAWDGQTIVFGQYSTQTRGLYRVPSAGGTPELLIPALLPDKGFSPPWCPQFVNGGEKLLYLRFTMDAGTQTIRHAIMLSSADGKNERIVAPISSRAYFTNGHLLYVRDGALLAQPFDVEKGELKGDAKTILEGLHYFRSTGTAAFSVSENGLVAWRSARKRSRIVWIDRAGIEGAPVATAHVLPDGRLSPDGTRYAVGTLDAKQGVSDIWVYDLTRQNPERRTFARVDEKAPVWLPDGQSLFYRTDGGGGPPDIFRLDPGDQRGTLLHSGWGVDEPHDVSPDGKWLLFVDYFSTGTDINVLPLEGDRKARPFVATPFNEDFPRFSPDGRWVAYSSDVSGKPEVYLRSFNDPPVTTRVSKDGGTRPRWNRNGRELFFLGPDGRLMSAAVTNGMPGSPRLLFQAVELVDFDPAPDGSRFIAQLQEGAGDTAVHLLLNWPALLDQR